MDDKQTDKANLDAAGLSADAKGAGADASKAAPEPTKGADAPKPEPEPAKNPEPVKEPTKVKSLDEIARDAGVNERAGNDQRASNEQSRASSFGPNPDEKLGTSDPARLEPFRGGVDDRPRDGSTVTDVSSPDAKLRQIEDTERRKDALNRANQEGHEVNMDRIENEGQQAQDASRRAPTSGMEDNRNTPRIAKDGTKHWD